ncbi:DUF1217 domain-containing protein [Albimonas sp. CAU 1670]|uniref:DUF1217 domain-containing protein n=1 Tax=Albimonas sp. CAU 1670 TaxID=3032599 RepID=UPI0023DB3BAF|nr:DUF1217 domain-containing protein [Albimonas sp. CAU 1670]MDF2235599.1 DUF1217 domain-containing protein [Albimonas sp. CAU 1670]
MAFTPLLPLGGVAGWSLLQRIEDRQRETFEKSPEITRAVAHFQETIHKAATAEDLVNDRQLLQVALGAFGLEDEIDKRAFIRKVLESDPLDTRSFANRLVDPRYRDLANAFGYGSVLGARVVDAGFADKIATAYKERRFEVAVGDADSDLRLAMNARRELAKHAAEAERTGRDGSSWFAALGDRPLRAVIEKAYGLPDAFAQIDLDQQRETLRAKTRELFGEESIAVFSDPEKVDTMIRRFLARSAAENGTGGYVPGQGAVTLLQAGAASFANLVQSRFG